MNRTVIGKSAKSVQLYKLIDSIAADDASVLITGESGAGKELAARAIHDRSNRKGAAFIAVNCGAIPAELLESELFGHKKGAFTGAISDRVGKVQAADGGTLFLDEIGDMPLDMQVKLLRVLQERVITPVGANLSTKVDIRILSATHRDLDEEISAGRFRSDLFFRLNVVPLQVPPLRERTDEVIDFIELFGTEYARDGQAAVCFDGPFLKLFSEYDWPGNIRELSNMVHRLSVLYPGQLLNLEQVDLNMLPSGMVELIDSEVLAASQSAESNADSVNEIEDIVMQAQGYAQFRNQGKGLKQMLSDIEEDIIEKALEDSNGNVSKCAKLLSMQRTTLIERIKKYGLSAS